MPDEGDMPRQVDTEAEPELSRNRYPRDEQYTASEIQSSPRHPGGGTDNDQIRQMTQPEAPNPPLGPNTISGGQFGTPMPPPVDGVHDPTAEVSGMYGGAEHARSKEPESHNDSDDKS